MKILNFKDKITQIIEPIIDQYDFKLYELNFVHEYESEVIQVLLENKDVNKKHVEFDDLISANEAISAKLDEIKELEDAYIIEVSSAGIERQIKSKEDLIKAVGSYLYIKTSKSIENTFEFQSDLLDYKDDKFMFSFFLKGKPKKVSLTYEEIEFVRFAVKF